MKSSASIAAKLKNLFWGLATADKDALAAAAGRYWRLSGRDDRIQDQSHWCGAMRWNRDRWLVYGDFYMAGALRLLHDFAGKAYIGGLGEKTALEWGCGGGANVRCLCKAFAQVYGTDIAEDTLDECRRRMSAMGFVNFSPVHFPAPEPEAVLRKITAETVDFILSIAVFQHFPSKTYTQNVLMIIAKLLKPGGFAWIQVRYFDGSEKYRQKDDDYAKNVITMTSFTFEEFSSQLRQAGLFLLHSEKDIEQENLYHEYFFVRK
jgi:SAM-dependent methyltransferase